MPEARKVTTGQVAQQAIERLGRQVREIVKKERQRDEALRQLLSYCEDQAQHSGYALEESAYDDVAQKLRGILDGE